MPVQKAECLSTSNLIILQLHVFECNVRLRSVLSRSPPCGRFGSMEAPGQAPPVSQPQLGAQNGVPAQQQLITTAQIQQVNSCPRACGFQWGVVRRVCCAAHDFASVIQQLLENEATIRAIAENAAAGRMDAVTQCAPSSYLCRTTYRHACCCPCHSPTHGGLLQVPVEAAGEPDVPRVRRGRAAAAHARFSCRQRSVAARAWWSWQAVGSAQTLQFWHKCRPRSRRWTCNTHACDACVSTPIAPAQPTNARIHSLSSRQSAMQSCY